MAQACRDNIRKLWTDVPNTRPKQRRLPASSSNPGLIMSRFLELDIKDDRFQDCRRDIQSAMLGALIQSGEVYQDAFNRYVTALPTLNKNGNFKTVRRMVIGLGGENVLEAGLSLHHTYGTPLLPGTALKGLASHYCDQVWGADMRFKKGGGRA
jgi:CRISPR-associated protein Cmr6